MKSQPCSTELADALAGKITIVGIPWTFPSGRIDWLFNPTAAKGPFNVEWTWLLTRMTFWSKMADAYEETHDYELFFQIDTTETVVSVDRRRLLTRFGRKWDLEIVVEEGGEISTETGLTTPRLSRWFIGRNDIVNHPATTVRVRTTKDKNHLFKTRLRIR